MQSKFEPSIEPMDLRETSFSRLQNLHGPEVLILGGGVNGAALLRDLSLNGVSAVLLDTNDFCAGASSASSRMAHGGLRYLEGREFRLVGESVRERNHLITHASHFVRPLEIVVPLPGLLRGFGRAVFRFLGLSAGKGPLSLATLKGALTMYEALGRSTRALPGHRTKLRRADFPKGLADDTKAVVSYFDGQILQPEGLIMEILCEAVWNSQNVAAINHITWSSSDGAFSVKDHLSDQHATLKPRIIVNASGAWIDHVNKLMGLKTAYVRGVKGAHLLIRNKALHRRMAGRAFYFDDGSGRMIISQTVGESVLVGTSEIDTPDPDDRHISDDEVTYLVRAINGLFTDIAVDRSQVVSLTTGIRPLRAGDGSANSAARDHAIEETSVNGRPVLSLVGGKWTTFRAFAESAADRLFELLERQRRVSTADRTYPGAVPCTLTDIRHTGHCDKGRADALYERYGAIAIEVAGFCAAGADRPIRSAECYSRREVEWLIRARAACTLQDITLHRSRLALDARLSIDALRDLASVLQEVLGRSDDDIEAELKQACADPRVIGLCDNSKGAA